MENKQITKELIDIDEIIEKMADLIDWQHYIFDRRRAKKYLLSLPIQWKRKEHWKEFIIISVEEREKIKEKARKYDNLN